MILRELHIDGFGIHHDLRHEFGPGLNLIAGPNEAGKSTIHAFVRGMLYGFPSGNSRESRHPPLRGGNHGGRLSLETAEGIVRILRSGTSRKGLRVELPGGGSGGQEILDVLLRNTDAQLFRNVFAFGLDELADFGGLTGPEMELRIFDTAVAGAGRSVSELVTELQQLQSEELTPRKGRIRALVSRLDELERELREARSRARGHAALAARELEAEVELERARKRLRELKAEAGRWQTLITLWRSETRRREAVRTLAALDIDETRSARLLEEGFSAGDGGLLLRLDRMDERLDALEREEEGRSVGEARIAVELAGLAPREELARIAGRVAALRGDAKLQADHRQRLPALARSIGEKARAAEDLLASLGDEWSEEGARAVDRSLPRREELEGFALRFREQDRLLATARSAVDSAGAQLERSIADLADRRRLLGEMEEPPAADELERRSKALAALRAAKEEREHAARRLQALRDQRLSRPSSPLPRAALLAAAAAFALGAAIAFTMGEAVGGAIAALAAVAALAFAASSRHGTGAEGQAPGSLAEVEKEAEATLRRIEGELRAHAASVGVVGDPNAAEIEAAAEAVQRGRAQRHRWDDLQRDRSRSEEASRQARDQLAKAEEGLTRAEEASKALDAEWRGWATATFGRELPRGISPEAARERLSRLDDAVKLLDARRREDEERERLERALREWEAGVAEVAAEAGVEGSGESALSRLEDAIAEERRRAESRRVLEADARRLEAERVLAREERERLLTARAALLHEAGAEDRGALVRNLEEQRRIEELLGVLREAERAIEETLGAGEEGRLAREELGKGEKERWELLQQEARAEEEEAERRVESLTQSLALLGKERSELESSADVPRIAAEIAQHRSELAESVRRWRTAALLEKVLQSSLEELRRERQPAVLRHASEAFARITRGRYAAILQTLQGDGVEVLDAREDRIPASSLSRGTREQLYVCIRLGLAAAFAEQGTHLPLLMDDVLVNFDPDRADGVAGVLADFARNHQTILFTCHPGTVERIAAADPSVRLLDLGTPSTLGLKDAV